MNVQLYSIILLFALFSCSQHKEKVNPSFEKNEIIEEIEYQTELDSAFVSAINTAKKHKSIIFREDYRVALPNEIEITVHQDYFFSSDTPHLIVSRNGVGTRYIDVLLKIGEDYQKVLSHEEWMMTYMGDTIFDVNGDGYNDFVINGYGANGCCLKAYSLIYLYRADSLSFSEKYDFLNPTFSPKEKLVRGVCYGHPGETELYKYQWCGERLDTVEYVSYEKDDLKGEKTGYILINSSYPSDRRNKVLKRLKNIPKEYLDIYGYDWFTGDIMID